MLVQLVCLDRRYQRMNCYNIREIQTILKSKYSPNTTDTADVHFGLDETVIGLRYQIWGTDLIDTSVFTYYKNALLSHPRYRALHEFLHKPIVEFDSVKLFMSRCSFMFNVLQMMYEDESLDIRHLFGSTKSTAVSGPSSLVNQFLPHTSYPTELFMGPVGELSFSNAQLTSYSLAPSVVFDRLVSPISYLLNSSVQPAAHTLRSFSLS